MNTTKLSEWLNIAAAAGVIVSLLLVAYEIRLSNRIGLEQASAARWDRWDLVQEMGSSPHIADVIVRAHEGDTLTRAEAFMLNNYVDQYFSAISYEVELMETGTFDSSQEVSPAGLQILTGSEYFVRRWSVVKDFQYEEVERIVESALTAANQRDITAYLDYIRGATDQLE